MVISLLFLVISLPLDMLSFGCGLSILNHTRTHVLLATPSGSGSIPWSITRNYCSVIWLRLLHRARASWLFMSPRFSEKLSDVSLEGSGVDVSVASYAKPVSIMEATKNKQQHNIDTYIKQQYVHEQNHLCMHFTSSCSYKYETQQLSKPAYANMSPI